MKKFEMGCPECPAFGVFCPRRPKKEDYNFPKEENQYLIDLECGVYSCKETICRMSQYIEKLNKLKEN